MCRFVYERIDEPDAAQTFERCTAPADRIWLVLFRHNNFPTQIEDMQDYFAASDPDFEVLHQADFLFISVYLFQASP
jgi:hypothetical protein